ncbi:hypothetical protein BC629DRAFT_1518962 [Irpex lacteus]|nr:hypothetical protein BC629DRAFT_1518962 [Irpex lacteus]
MKSIKPANADSTKTRRRASTRKSTTEKPVPMNIPSTGGVVSTLNFSQPAPSQPDAQMYVPPASSSTPAPIHTPPVGAPSFNQSVFPVLPHQPVVWSPPPPSSYPVEQFTPAPAPPPPVQYSPPIQPYTPHLSGGAAYSPPPPPVESSAAGPSAPRTQSSSPGGTSKAADYSGVSFAPISTPAIEAKVVAIHEKKAARPKPKKLPPVPMPPPIRCRACQETGLPLLMGGRICRQCLETGRLSEAIPDIASGTTQTGRKSPSEPASPTSTSPAE